MRTFTAFLFVVVALPPCSAFAQGTDAAAAIELTGGYGGLVDDATVDGAMFGGAARVRLSPRISIGPEAQYMSGPGADHSWLITGNLYVDFLEPGAGGRPRTTPYVVVGGGWFQNTTRVGTGAYSSGDPAFTAGVGVRAWLSRRVYVSPEFRFQWELHFRVSGSLGVAFGR